MALITDREIKDTIKQGNITIEPFEEKQLKAATYDIRLGKKAILSKAVTIEELKNKLLKKKPRK